MGFSKKILIFLKIAKRGKFAIECVSKGVISLKCLFRPNYVVFLAKDQKILTFGKIRKCDEGRVFFSKKKRFHPLKLNLYQYGKAQNMPVVAGAVLLKCNLNDLESFELFSSCFQNHLL